MIDQYYLLEDEQYSRLNIAYSEAIKNIPIESQISEIDRMIIEILDSIKRCTNERILHFQIKLLAISLNKDTRSNLHISFPSVLRQLDNDEIMILGNVHKNGYEFIETCDYDSERAIFHNYQYQKFDFPKKELSKPDDFWFYIYHLQDILKIIRWPIIKTEPLMENGIQTGLVKYSQMIETEFGMKFNKCLFDF